MTQIHTGVEHLQAHDDDDLKLQYLQYFQVYHNFKFESSCLKIDCHLARQLHWEIM